MIWTGNVLHVIVAPKQGMAGKWGDGGVRARLVYALKDVGGDVTILVADDSGTLIWVSPGNYNVTAVPQR